MSCAFLHSYGAVCDACAGCQSACAAHRPNGTRARNVPSRIAPAPLRNHQIAFGCGRFPVRRISHRCVPRGGGGPRGWHGRAAVFVAPPLRADACAPFGFGFAESPLRFASAHFRGSAFIREGQSIRRYGALGLVAMPPCANRIRPGGVLPLAAPDSLWPRGRHASPLARYRHLSGSAGRVPRPLQ